MPNVRYTISFSSKDRELVQFIEDKRKRNNLSAYIRELIREDMGKGKEHELEQIFLYVEKRLQENGFTMKENGDNTMKTIIDEIDKEIFLNLF